MNTFVSLKLGVEMTWQPHIRHLLSKLSRTIGILYRTRYYLNTQSLYLILHSLFFSHIKYGILCWARASKTTIRPVVVLFNRAICCIHFLHSKENKTHILVRNKLLQIHELFKLELGKFMFNFSKGNLPHNFNKYFQRTHTVHKQNYPANIKLKA